MTGFAEVLWCHQQHQDTPQSKEILDNDKCTIDQKIARTIPSKYDLHLIPILGCLYLVSFLDRSNIANARLQGSKQALYMPSNGYNHSLWIFSVLFILIEIPSNLILSWQWVKPAHLLGTMMLLLGEDFNICICRFWGLT